MSGEVESISFSDKPAPDLKVKVWVYHEENEILKQPVLPKNDSNFAKKFNDYVNSGLYLPPQEDTANFLFTPKPRKPKAFVCLFEGPYRELDNYISGEFVDDGQVIKEVSPPHPRTWSVGIPSTMASKAYYEPDKQRVIDAIKARNAFSEIVETTWEQMRKMR